MLFKNVLKDTLDFMLARKGSELTNIPKTFESSGRFLPVIGVPIIMSSWFVYL